VAADALLQRFPAPAPIAMAASPSQAEAPALPPMAAAVAAAGLGEHLQPSISLGRWPLDWAESICPRIVGAALPIQIVTVERTVPQAVNLSAGALPSCSLQSRLAIVRQSIVPQFAIKFAQIACFRELKFALDESSPATKAVHAPLAWGVTNVPAQSAIYSMAIAKTYQHFGAAPPDAGGMREFVRLKILPGIFWTFIREGFATGGGLMLGPKVQARLDDATGGALPSWGTKFLGGLLAGWTCAFATMLPHNCALTAARVAQQGEQPTTLSSFRTLLREQGLARAATVNFQQRCVLIAVIVGCLNTANVLAHPEHALVARLRSC